MNVCECEWDYWQNCFVILVGMTRKAHKFSLFFYIFST